MDLIQYLKETKSEKQVKRLKQRLKNKKVLFYGTGQMFVRICENCSLSDINIVGISDKKYTSANIGEEFMGFKKVPLENIKDANPDYVVVSIQEYKNVINDIKSYVCGAGIKVIPLIKKTMKVKIKQYLERIFPPKTPANSLSQADMVIKNHTSHGGKYVSFGEENPDKIFYVIYRSGYGAGFISNVRYIIRYLALLENSNLIPVIDTVNFPSFYSEKVPVHNTMNWWEYYFEPVSQYSLDEVYRSKNVILCDDKYPNEISPFTRDAILMENLEKSVYDKFFRFNELFKDELMRDERYIKAMEFLQKPTLGFHYRGTDMTYEKRHVTPMVLNQAIRHMEDCMKKENLHQVYLATDSEEYRKKITEYCTKKGIPILCLNETFGGVPEIVENWHNSKPIRYEHGKDMLLDLICLSNCNAMMGIRTNILVCAQYLTKNENMKTYYIQNGLNSPYRSLNKLRWKIIKNLPANHFILRLFGLLDIVEVSV